MVDNIRMTLSFTLQSYSNTVFRRRWKPLFIQTQPILFTTDTSLKARMQSNTRCRSVCTDLYLLCAGAGEALTSL
jgi:hypothetical protein